MERSTRHFRVTEIGQAFYKMPDILPEAYRAKSIVSEAQLHGADGLPAQPRRYLGRGNPV